MVLCANSRPRERTNLSVATSPMKGCAVTSSIHAIEMRRPGRDLSDSTTSQLVFRGTLPDDQLVDTTLCEAFTYRDTYRIETSDGVHLTIVHASHLSSQNLHKRLSDIASALNKSFRLELITSVPTRRLTLGSMAILGAGGTCAR